MLQEVGVVNSGILKPQLNCDFYSISYKAANFTIQALGGMSARNPFTTDPLL